MEKPEIENDITVRYKKLLCLTGLILTVCLYAFRVFLMLEYAFKYVDSDTTIFWLGTVYYSNGFFPEPFFFGQRYGLMIESFLAVPFYLLHIPLWITVPLVSMLTCTLPFIIIALYTWKKDALTSILILLIPCLTGLRYDVVTTVPRSFGGGFLLTIIGSLLLMSKYNGKPLFAQLWHGTGIFLMILGLITSIASATISGFAIGFIIIREFLNGKSFDANFHEHKYIGSLIGLFLGIAVCFGLDYFYTIHPDYDFYPSPPFKFSFKALSENLSGIRDIFAAFSPDDDLWFVFPAFVALIILFMLIVRRKSGFHLPLLTILSLIGTLMYMTLTKTRDFEDQSYLYSQIRVFIYIPYLIAMLLCASTFYEKKPIDTAKARPIMYIAVPLMILLVLSAGIMKSLNLHNVIKQDDTKLTRGDDYLEVRPVDDVLDEAEKTKKFCMENDIQYVVNFMPYSYTSTYAIGALNYGSLTTYNAYFERRTWIYNEMKEKPSGNVRIYAIFDDRRGLVILPSDVSVVECFKKWGYTR